jgi:hypothetical protein
MSYINHLNKYLAYTPAFFKVKNIVNSHKIDHAAFRHLKSPVISGKYNIQPEKYTFPTFNATARWYKQTSNTQDILIPRLFVSTYMGRNVPLISSYVEYQDINEQNSYLAWTVLFEGHINHLALIVDDIELATEKCIQSGIKMNEDGGLYKVSNDKLLIQTATIADYIQYTFADGKTEYIPYTFVELIQRKRDGFEQDNAKRIFTSTKLV